MKNKREEIAKKYLEMVGLKDRLYHTSNQNFRGPTTKSRYRQSPSYESGHYYWQMSQLENIASAQAEEVMAIFQDLNEQGHTIVMITHEPDIAQHATRIIPH